MTMIAGIGFTDEVIILSDSRVSFLDKNLKPKDTLKKIYKLSKYSCFAYTSGDVEFTHHIIESITKYATNIQVRKTDVFLKMITERASQEYITLSRKFNKLPDMLFIYAGLVDGSYKIPRNKFVAIKKKYDENIWMPKKLKDIKISSTEKTVSIPGPTPLLIKQKFPGGVVASTKGWDYCAEGSGQDIEKDLDKYFSKLFFIPGAFNKAVILQDLCDQFIGKAGIDTIGGLVQIFMINKEGVQPLAYVQKNGDKEIVKRYMDLDGNWIEEDCITGTKKAVGQKII
ncbi:MAG TPA: hypothetical protein DIW31_06185 [Bacteroidales bacterium]|nr:hypothetical protein [Bacteroidales bacterium]